MASSSSPTRSTPTSPAAPCTPCFPRSLLAHFPCLKELEEAFKCRVCYETFNDPVMTSRCAHNFCSICVRKYVVSYKPQCPQCLETLHEGELRPNRALKDVMDIFFNDIMPRLAEAFKGKHFVSLAQTPSRAKSPLATPLASTPTTGRTADSFGPPAPKQIFPRSSQTTSAQGKNTAAEKPSLPQKVHPEQKKVAPSEVACPVCSVEIPQRNVNAHLDKCLKDQEHQQRQGVVSSSEQSRPGRKPVQKIVYHLLKDTELRKRMRELGLDDKGDRKMLVSRHQRFTVLWNAQCEASKPQSKLEIIMQLRKEEQTEKKEAAAAAASRSNLLDYDRNTDPGEIDLKKREYMKQNKGSFDDLMRAARKAKPKTEFAHTPKKSPINNQSRKLYMTPKRKTSSELQESLSSKRLKQKGIEAAVDSQLHTLKSTCPVCDLPVVNSDMNRHLDKCLSEPKADGDEDEVPSVSDPRMVQATVDEDELSEGWKDFCDSTDEERPEEPLPEKENVSSLDSSPTGSQASTSGLNHGDDDLLAQPLPLESPLEGAARMKTKASSDCDGKGKAGGKAGVAKNTRSSTRRRILAPKRDDDNDDEDFILSDRE